MRDLIDHKRVSIRSDAILTTSYVAGTVIKPSDHADQFNQLIIYVAFTLGSLTTAEVKVDFSNDNSTFYQETFSAVVAGKSTDTVGEHSFDSTGNFRLAIPINDTYIKISAKGTGTVTSSTMQVDAVLARN